MIGEDDARSGVMRDVAETFGHCRSPRVQVDNARPQLFDDSTKISGGNVVW